MAEAALDGPWLAWTSGAIMGNARPQTKGRIFVGHDRFCFIADGPYPDPERVYVLKYVDLNPVEGTFKRLVPNAFVRFGDLELMGVKKAMRVLHDECAKAQAAT
jgi:hypothetical protein